MAGVSPQRSQRSVDASNTELINLNTPCSSSLPRRTFAVRRTTRADVCSTAKCCPSNNLEQVAGCSKLQRSFRTTSQMCREMAANVLKIRDCTDYGIYPRRAALSISCIVLFRFATYCVPDSVPRETFKMSKTEPRKWIASVMSYAELYDYISRKHRKMIPRIDQW